MVTATTATPHPESGPAARRANPSTGSVPGGCAKAVGLCYGPGVSDDLGVVPSAWARWRQNLEDAARGRTAAGASRRALLAVAAPGLVALSPAPVDAVGGLGAHTIPVLAGSWVLFLVLVGVERPIPRLLATAAWVGAVAWAAWHTSDRPASLLALGIGGALVALRLWPAPTVLDLEARRGGDAGLARVSTAAATALAVLGLAWWLDVKALEHDVVRVTALTLVAWVPVWFAPTDRIALFVPRVVGWVVPIVLLLARGAGGRHLTDPWFLSIGPLSLALGAVLQGGRRGREPVRATEVLLENPGLALVGSFLVWCLVGMVLLSLPGATTSPITRIDAAFTAVSATCVTGLSVLDTPTAFTVVGQALLLLQIQVGGLGIMTFSSAIFVLFGRRMSVLHEAAAAELVGAEALSEVQVTVGRIVRVTAFTEGLGAVVLSGLFWLDGDPAPTALWRGVFTAVSAFCNAGFALQSDSLMGYAARPGILSVIGLLVVVGGLGPPVVSAIPAVARRAPVSLHVRLVLWASLVLLAFPALVFAGNEWEASLFGLSTADRIVNAGFQAVTLRTAGFHSVDLTAIRPGTWILMVLTMFVGGSPGSTAGGIKTTTFAILLLTVVAAMRGRAEVQAFGRRIPQRTVYQAVSIGAVGLLTGVAAVFALELTHDIAIDVAIFEIVSALATVGLTTGGTAELDAVGKIIVMICMFAGRVGPVTLFALVSGVDGARRVRYPEGRVPVG